MTLEAQLDLARKALEFYADTTHYKDGNGVIVCAYDSPVVMLDRGQRAKAALRALEPKPE